MTPKPAFLPGPHNRREAAPVPLDRARAARFDVYRFDSPQIHRQLLTLQKLLAVAPSRHRTWRERAEADPALALARTHPMYSDLFADAAARSEL